MAEIIHFPPPCDPDDPEKLFADALARAGHNPKVQRAVEDAYTAGYLAACREMTQVAEEINKMALEITRLLQEMNSLTQERLKRTKEEIRMLIGKNVKLLPKM